MFPVVQLPMAAILFSGHVEVPTISSGRASEYYLTVD
jgi:hypothetical protein